MLDDIADAAAGHTRRWLDVDVQTGDLVRCIVHHPLVDFDRCQRAETVPTIVVTVPDLALAEMLLWIFVIRALPMRSMNPGTARLEPARADAVVAEIMCQQDMHRQVAG